MKAEFTLKLIAKNIILIFIYVVNSTKHNTWVKHILSFYHSKLHRDQGKLDMVKKEMERLNIDSLRISEVKWIGMGKFYFISVQSLSPVWLFASPWTAACQASLSITNSQSLLRLMSIKLVMPSNHLILCHPILFLPSVVPSIRVFSNESVLHISCPKYWSFSFSISPSNE